MVDVSSALRQCLGNHCSNVAESLQCPTCLKLGRPDSYFCSQDCFRKNWATHKAVHKRPASTRSNGSHDPFPAFQYTGPIQAEYPLSAPRTVPASIRRPDWATSGIPRGERRLHPTKIAVLDAAGQDAMRKVSRLAREVLDVTAAALRPGVTTDCLDEICHSACVERDCYPSPLNYNGFPKSICTSINEIVCHGIPDRHELADGDIINLDVSVYHGGYHADVNETYYVGDKARANPDAVRLVETTRECLDLAIALVKPGCPIREFGAVIEAHAKSRGCRIMTTWGGHGINTEFHPPPWIPHYGRNRAVGSCKAGMTFTIEPILTLGKDKDVYWPDKWTNATVDGKWTAQFEHTLLVTETGVEVLTVRKEDSPGGPVQMAASQTG